MALALAALLTLALCPVRLIEPSGAYDQWVAGGCEGFRCENVTLRHLTVCRTCILGPDHPVGQDGPWREFDGDLWSPPDDGLWSVLREARWNFDDRIVRMWWWQEQVDEPCSPPPEPPLFADGFESGDTSAWSRTVIRLGPGIFSNGFEEGDVSAWN